MLIDDVKIQVTAGHGGSGSVSFNKNKMMLGPTGGTGGQGGNIFCEGVSDLGALRQFRFRKKISADNGQVGRGQFRDGHDGADIIIKLPVGTIVHNLNTDKLIDIKKIGDNLMIAKGGRGGRGNFHFRSATNTSPKESEQGKPGQSFDIRLELKLIADIGLIGLPNVGKTSLLNELTSSSSKVANYPFTTLEPNLGVFGNLIVADIPGLIEGASDGKGLGIKFLKHIERTKILFHLVAANSNDPIMDYNTVRAELEKFNPKLLEKNEYVFISKCDESTPEKLSSVIKNLSEFNPQIYPISIIDSSLMKKAIEVLRKLSSEK